MAFNQTAERKDTLKQTNEMIIALLKRHQRQWHVISESDNSLAESAFVSPSYRAASMLLYGPPPRQIFCSRKIILISEPNRDVRRTHLYNETIKLSAA